MGCRSHRPTRWFLTHGSDSTLKATADPWGRRQTPPFVAPVPRTAFRGSRTIRTAVLQLTGGKSNPFPGSPWLAEEWKVELIHHSRIPFFSGPGEGAACLGGGELRNSKSVACLPALPFVLTASTEHLFLVSAGSLEPNPSGHQGPTYTSNHAASSLVRECHRMRRQKGGLAWKREESKPTVLNTPLHATKPVVAENSLPDVLDFCLLGVFFPLRGGAFKGGLEQSIPPPRPHAISSSRGMCWPRPFTIPAAASPDCWPGRRGVGAFSVLGGKIRWPRWELSGGP